MNDMVVSVRNLSKRYSRDQPRAVDNFSLDLQAGEVFGFVGPNGSGKTTTIKMLLNLVLPDCGEGTILGRDFRNDNVEIRRHVSYMDSETPLYQNMRGREFLDFFNSFYSAFNPQRFNDLCQRFEVPLERKIKSYSSGQKQQTALIAALSHESRLLILDEPTRGLDPSKKHLFLEVIRQRADEGAAVIISSHVLSEIESICSRVSFIRKGMLVANETIEEARSQLEDKLFVTVPAGFDRARLQVRGVSSIDWSGNTAMLTINGGPRDVIKAVAEFPITGLRYRQASLDDLYASLYLENGDEEETK